MVNYQEYNSGCRAWVGPMKLDELLELLHRIKQQHGGDDDIVIKGLYSETSRNLEVYRARNDQTSCIVIETDIG